MILPFRELTPILASTPPGPRPRTLPARHPAPRPGGQQGQYVKGARAQPATLRLS
jgi:hypothetical protein